VRQSRFSVRLPLTHLAVSFAVAVLIVMIGWRWSPWFFPADWRLGVAWLVGSWVAALIIHVTGHIVAARWSGRGAYRSILWIFGDSPDEYQLPEISAREALVAIAGPLANMVGCGVAAMLWWIGGASPHWPGIAWMGLGAASVVVGTVNTLPGLPLDGGRIVTALLLYLHGGSSGTVRLAIALGRLMALLLLVQAVLLLQVEARAAVLGLWLGWLGWTLGTSLRWERRRLMVASAGRTLPVASLLGAQHRVGTGRPIGQVAEALLGAERRPVALVTNGDVVVGVLLAERLLPALRRDAEVTVADVMMPIERVPKVGADEPASVALELLLGSSLPAVAVSDGQRVIGVLTPSTIERWD